MKESMAGTWIFGIVALFIVLFSSFLAYSISYTKAFKVKNEILNYIEQSEGFTTSAIVRNKDIRDLTTEELETTDTVDVKAYLLINSMGYNTADIDCTNYGTMYYGGYCVKKVCYSENKSKTSNSRVVYKVTTFIKVSIPVINIHIKLPIMGETKALYYENTQSIGCPTVIDEGGE